MPEILIDINRIEGLSYIKEANGHLAIGAMTRESEIDESDLVRQNYALLADTARVIADPLVRNMATVGGNLAHADPANDHPATMIALSAQVVATGKKGERVIPIDDFFVGLLTTALKPDEILTEIRIPAPAARSGGAYAKLKRKTGAEFAVLPPQNATGNWVKVVQRVPVRIAIEETGERPPLRAGMTVQVSVDTGRERSAAELVREFFTPARARDAQ